MYGKSQPVPFTRALLYEEWLHQFRDSRVKGVLDYPPPHSGPLLWFPSRDPCMESPNQCLSLEPCCTRNGCISFEIQGSKVCSTIPPPHSRPLFWFLSRDPCMESPNQCLSPEPCFTGNGCISFEIQVSKVCSTIRPLTLGHCFGFSQGTHVWKAPTSAFHQSLVVPGMVASVSRSKGRKCARLSASSHWAIALVSLKGPMYGKPQPVPFSTALLYKEWLHQFPDPRVESVLHYPPPHFGPLLWFVSRDPCMESPNRCPLPEPCFARNGCISFEMQGLKVRSTIRPLTLGHCFGFSQGTHIWKAPTRAFYQSLVLPGMVASVSRCKG